VVGVKVCEENVVDVEGDSVAHHLALRSFTTIEEKCFSFTEKGDRGDVPFDSWSRGGSAKESQA
jgi:hypothetical protein